MFYYNVEIKRKILFCIVSMLIICIIFGSFKKTSYSNVSFEYRASSATEAIITDFFVVENTNNVNVLIPDAVEIDGKSYIVRYIAPNLFSGSNCKEKNITLKSVTFNKFINVIPEMSFIYNEDIKYIYNTEHITEIGNNCFTKCKNLKYLTLNKKHAINLHFQAFSDSPVNVILI